MSRVAVSLALAGVLISTGVAAARSGHRTGRPAAFAGRCQFSGTVDFRPPLTDTPSAGRDFAAAGGVCSGSFTDRHGRAHDLSGATVRYVASDEGLTSCADGVSRGGGYLIFPWGRLAFSLSEARAAAGSSLELSGRNGGSASGTAAVSPSEDPVKISEECAASGLRSVAIDIEIATTPVIAG